MNSINPKKLLNSKWTAAVPINKEKHFIVTEIEFNEEGIVISCLIEAEMTKKEFQINWHDLKDKDNWLHGWQ